MTFTEENNNDTNNNKQFNLKKILCILYFKLTIATYCFSHNFSGDFLKTLEDPDLNVRRVALVTFNSAAHNKPSLIRDLLDTVLPHLYNETKVRKELIREVSWLDYVVYLSLSFIF